MVRSVEMPAKVSFSSDLVRSEELNGSAVAARTVQPGEPLPRSALGSAASSNGARVMAVPVDSWQAVGGEVDVGDQVDVIDTGSQTPRYVLSAAPVVGRATSDSAGGIIASGAGKLWLNVEVTSAQALDLAAVIEAGKFVVVRPTGVPNPGVATGESPPTTGPG
jgi:Flp pilus assembly protein CpaB